MVNALSAIFISRNVTLLAIAQAFANSLQTMGIATTPLVAAIVLGEEHKAYATMPLVFTQIGLMLATVPASLLMGRFGRRLGFSLGALIGIAAGIVGVIAVYQASFWMLCLTAFLQGAAIAIGWYYRFAAADATPPHMKARAISFVLFAGVLSGVIGPESAKWAKDLLAPVTFAGVYVMFCVMSILTLVTVQGLNIPPPTVEERTGPARRIAEIARQPAFIVAVLSSMMGYGVMTTMMSATPLAMIDCGFSFYDSATVIQFHVISMFAPALFTGYLINRFGVLTIIFTGALIQFGCLLIAMAGIGFHNFLLANMLVGMGWNFCFIGGTTLLTTVYRPSERAKTQAAHDFLEYLMTAISTGTSGIVLATAGWGFVNLIALPMVAVVLLASSWLYLRHGPVALVAHHK
ncbi:MAG: MFS transporter [Hyphomicrobiaceae bacterium]